MKEILANLAQLDLIQYCKAHGLDPSGTHVYKYPRAYRYALVKNDTGQAIVTLSFYKNQVPSYFVHV